MSNIVLYQNLHVNYTYQSLFRTMADMFRDEWFPRTTDIIISTYDKSVERYRQRKNNTNENFSPSYPFITFNPSLEIEPDDTIGKILYNYPDIINKKVSNEWKPIIYQDDNIYVAPNFNRYTSEIEMILWCGSVYELLDYRTRVYQFFRGINRYIQTQFDCYFVIPDEIKLFEYDNPYTGENYNIDWDNSIAEVNLIRAINQEKMIVPVQVKPLIRLVSINDGSEKYGDPSDDEISNYRLVVTMQWESWIPVHVILVAEALPTPCVQFELDLDVGFQYSAIAKQVNKYIITPIHRLITYVEDLDNPELGTVQLIWDKSFIYTITENDKNSFTNDEFIDITLPENEMTSCVFLRVFYRGGELVRDFQWKYLSSTSIRLIGFNLKTLLSGDLISFELYKIG